MLRVLHRLDNFWVVVKVTKNNPEKVLYQRLPKLFKRIKEIHSKFMICLWKEEIDKKVHSNQDQIPTTLRDLHFYFNWANPKPKGGPIYMNIWVILDLTHNQMLDKNV